MHGSTNSYSTGIQFLFHTSHACREQFGMLIREWWFHLLIISFTSFTGILITRQYQYTKRINFLQRMLVSQLSFYRGRLSLLSVTLSLSLSLSLSLALSPSPPPPSISFIDEKAARRGGNNKRVQLHSADKLDARPCCQPLSHTRRQSSGT